MPTYKPDRCRWISNQRTLLKITNLGRSSSVNTVFTSVCRQKMSVAAFPTLTMSVARLFARFAQSPILHTQGQVHQNPHGASCWSAKTAAAAHYIQRIRDCEPERITSLKTGPTSSAYRHVVAALAKACCTAVCERYVAHQASWQ